MSAPHVGQANRVAQAFCAEVIASKRGFAVNEMQRQLLFSLFRRAYMAGHGHANEQRKEPT